MTNHDLVADTLTRIRNANRARISEVKIIKSNLTYNIVKILKQEGFIEGYDSNDSSENITLKLKYKGIKQIPYISNLSRISRSGSRVYVNKKRIPRVFGGIGIAILSTSKGLLTDYQARTYGVGGEILFYIW
uniref:Small ribosomal subunit protein uS8c n=1 Tax=Trachelomonas volvocina TaxID=103340 RepID=A0A0G3VSD8_9EUGL|nr:ribosomal protein S8 [Trachelomonas volvocina]AKL82429.1 ribosomal protein S8 [Trachelomonas volvocina]